MEKDCLLCHLKHANCKYATISNNIAEDQGKK